jgi:hypothetical protein
MFVSTVLLLQQAFPVPEALKIFGNTFFVLKFLPDHLFPNLILRQLLCLQMILLNTRWNVTALLSVTGAQL